MKLLQIELKILDCARFTLNNRSLKGDDLLEWSSDSETVKKNLREDEIYLEFPSLGLFGAFPKSKDKRINEKPSPSFGRND